MQHCGSIRDREGSHPAGKGLKRRELSGAGGSSSLLSSTDCLFPSSLHLFTYPPFPSLPLSVLSSFYNLAILEALFPRVLSTWPMVPLAPAIFSNHRWPYHFRSQVWTKSQIPYVWPAASLLCKPQTTLPPLFRSPCPMPPYLPCPLGPMTLEEAAVSFQGVGSSSCFSPPSDMVCSSLRLSPHGVQAGPATI